MVLKAEVGRFDGEIKMVAFNEGESIQSLFEKVNLTVGSGEVVSKEDGSEIAVTSVAEDGETYLITGNLKQGRN